MQLTRREQEQLQKYRDTVLPGQTSIDVPAREPISVARRLSKDLLDHDFECALVFYPNRCPCDCYPIASTSICRSVRQIRLAREALSAASKDIAEEKISNCNYNDTLFDL